MANNFRYTLSPYQRTFEQFLSDSRKDLETKTLPWITKLGGTIDSFLNNFVPPSDDKYHRKEKLEYRLPNSPWF